MTKKETTSESSEKFIHKKSLGQNFLTSRIVPEWMCEAGEVQKNDIVFEIGPGTGMLTKTLLDYGATVYAIEADLRAYEILKSTFVNEIEIGQLKLFYGDARVITPSSLKLKNHSFKIIANIPYYLSGFLLRSSLENVVQPTLLVFLIQKELAVRIARDKKESLLALSVKVFGDPKYYKTVTRGHFNPSPKVDSAILQIKNINHNHFSEEGSQLFFELLHLGLGKKRKQLMTNLKEVYPKEQLETVFAEASLPLNIRGEDVPLTSWLQIFYLLHPYIGPTQMSTIQGDQTKYDEPY